MLLPQLFSLFLNSCTLLWCLGNICNEFYILLYYSLWQRLIPSDSNNKPHENCSILFFVIGRNNSISEFNSTHTDSH